MQAYDKTQSYDTNSIKSTDIHFPLNKERKCQENSPVIFVRFIWS